MTYTDGGGGGRARGTDPATAQAAAEAADAVGHMRNILRYLYVLPPQEPRNGWEIALALDKETTKDSVVPRLCPMRRVELISYVCNRPGPPPTLRGQMAYVITDYGRQALVNPEVWDAAMTAIAQLDDGSPLVIVDRANIAVARLTDDQWNTLVATEDRRRQLYG